MSLRAFLPVSLRLALRRIPATIAWFFRAPPPRIAGGFEHTICERASPLRREKAVYAEAVQRAKEHNVARVSGLLDGIVIPAGGTFSWHRTIGPPLASRGFRAGPELRNGALDLGVGGGVCQASNLLYWLAVHAGLDVVERHRHSFDLFPDDGRDVPFGAGATVLFPLRDLALKNPHAFAVSLAFSVNAGRLHGAVTGAELPAHRYALVERDARIERVGDAWWRFNRLERATLDGDGRTIAVVPLCENSARLCYEPTIDPPTALLEAAS